MRLSNPFTAATGLLAILAAAATPPATTVTLTLPSHPHLQAKSLPPSTHATLTSLGARRTAPLTAANAFVFRNVTPGSYLVDVHCATHAFAPLRLDVAADGGGGGGATAWETYRGNDWDNKGEAVPARDGPGGRAFEVRLLGAKNYFVERVKCELHPLTGLTCEDL
jgi:ER membrane protein complex subunit 7